jgi:hypothetical protein
LPRHLTRFAPGSAVLQAGARTEGQGMRPTDIAKALKIGCALGPNRLKDF